MFGFCSARCRCSSEVTTPTSEATVEAPSENQHVSRSRRARTPLRGPLVGSFGTSLAIQCLNVVTGVVLARSLGPTGRGELAAAYLFAALVATVGTIGLGDALTYITARGEHSLRDLVGTGYALAGVLSAVLVAVAFGLIPAIYGDYHGHPRLAMEVFLLYIPLNLIATFAIGIQNGLRAYKNVQMMRALVIVATAVGFVALALDHRLTLLDGVSVYLVAAVLWAGTGAVMTFRRVRYRCAVRVALARELLAYGIRSHPGAVSSLVNEFGDKFVISIFLPPSKLGIYVVAVTLTSLTGLVGSSVAIVALPAVASLGPGKERSSLAAQLSAITLLLSAAVSVPIMPLAPLLVRLFFGHSFAAAAPIAVILLVASMLLSLNRALGATLRAAGAPFAAGRPELIAMVVTIVALPALLPVLGVSGAAVASLLAYGTSSVLLLRAARSTFGVSLMALLVPSPDSVARSVEWLRRIRVASR